MDRLRDTIAWLIDGLAAALRHIAAAIRPTEPDPVADPARNGGSGEER